MKIKKTVGWLTAAAGALLICSCSLGGTSTLSGQVVVEDAPGSSPTCATAASAGELCVEGDVESNGNLDIAGTSTLTGAVTMASTLAVTGGITATGGVTQATSEITGNQTLTSAECGTVMFVTAAIDTNTITLPATSAGCVYEFVYNGADGGALLDISPQAADAVHGSCTLAASVLELSGSDDADFGFTKATINTGDRVTIVGDGSVGWFVTDCAGILANN
jgi:hypothetical protein